MKSDGTRRSRSFASCARPTGCSPRARAPRGREGLEVSEATYHRWRAQYGGMKADDVKRLKELERENALKRIVANKELEIEGLKEIAGKLVSPSRRRQAVLMLRTASASRSGGRADRRPAPLDPAPRAGRRWG